jgi:uncharacterized membrane protein YeaQ/YmgE (transglycosylase-associated protein family)
MASGVATGAVYEDSMDAIRFVVVGSIVGFAFARLVSWRRDNNVGWSMAVGMLGAFGGALLGSALGYAGGDPPTFVASVLAAIGTVATYLAVTMRPAA